MKIKKCAKLTRFIKIGTKQKLVAYLGTAKATKFEADF